MTFDRRAFEIAARHAVATERPPLDRLTGIGEIRRMLPLLEEAAIRDARAQRITWATIAFWMGVSHQAVIKRWRTRLYGDAYDPMSSRIRPDRLPPRGPAPTSPMKFWTVPAGE
ncbi:MAG TPA: hypothetical protein VM841_08960 [Actinomycetota bacterium]|nr:hypothetical protein [Actinomycetota bacterium]